MVLKEITGTVRVTGATHAILKRIDKQPGTADNDVVVCDIIKFLEPETQDMPETLYTDMCFWYRGAAKDIPFDDLNNLEVLELGGRLT